MLPIGYVLIALLVCAYLYVVYKITLLWISSYSKLKLTLYSTVVLLITTVLCYTIYESRYDIFAFLTAIIIYSLIIAYGKMKK